jgi:hypothetical protein
MPLDNRTVDLTRPSRLSGYFPADFDDATRYETI